MGYGFAKTDISPAWNLILPKKMFTLIKTNIEFGFAKTKIFWYKPILNLVLTK